MGYSNESKSLHAYSYVLALALNKSLDSALKLLAEIWALKWSTESAITWRRGVSILIGWGGSTPAQHLKEAQKNLQAELWSDCPLEIDNDIMLINSY